MWLLVLKVLESVSCFLEGKKCQKIVNIGVMWYYCLAGKGTMDITHEWCPKITSGEATSDFGTTSV
jgi:hypothetical protein